MHCSSIFTCLFLIFLWPLSNFANSTTLFGKQGNQTYLLPCVLCLAALLITIVDFVTEKPSLQKPIVFFHLPKVSALLLLYFCSNWNLSFFNTVIVGCFNVSTCLKTGGSSIREMFYRTRKEIFPPHAPFFIVGNSFLLWWITFFFFTNINIILGYNKIPHIFSIRTDHLKPVWLNRTACSVGFIGHYDLNSLSKVLYDLDFGRYGPTKCRRGWWDDLKNASDMQIAVRLLDKVTCLTVVREPLSFVESFYNFFMFSKTNLSIAEYLGGDMSPVNYTVGSMLKLPLYNLQSDWFFNVSPNDILKRCSVGIHEAFDEFVSHTIALYPPLQKQNSTHVNSNPYLKEKTGIPLKYKYKMAEKLSRDGKLWAHARGRLYPHSNISCNGIRWGLAGEFVISNSTTNCNCGVPSVCL